MNPSIVNILSWAVRVVAGIVAFDLAWMALVLARYWQNGPPPKPRAMVLLTFVMAVLVLGAVAIVRHWVFGS